MTLQSWEVYLLGALIAAVGLWRGRREHSTRVRNVRGSVIADEVSGSVTITNSEPNAAHKTDRKDEHGDRIAWVIAIVGVLIAAAQLVHEIVSSTK